MATQQFIAPLSVNSPTIESSIPNGTPGELPLELRFGASLTKDQVPSLDHGNDLNRRVMLMILTRTGAELVQWAAQENAEGDAQEISFLATVEALQRYKGYLEGLLDLTESAEARMLLAGSFATGIVEGESVQSPVAEGEPKQEGESMPVTYGTLVDSTWPGEADDLKTLVSCFCDYSAYPYGKSPDVTPRPHQSGRAGKRWMFAVETDEFVTPACGWQFLKGDTIEVDPEPKLEYGHGDLAVAMVDGSLTIVEFCLPEGGKDGDRLRVDGLRTNGRSVGTVPVLIIGKVTGFQRSFHRQDEWTNSGDLAQESTEHKPQAA